MIVVVLGDLHAAPGVIVTPARIALAVMPVPRRASSIASWRMCDSSAALADDTTPYDGHDPGRALRGHRVDLRALLEEAAAPQVLDPVDEAVGHDVLGHLHLLAVDAALRVVGEERDERAERERVHDDPDVRMAAGRARSRRTARASVASAAARFSSSAAFMLM